MLQRIFFPILILFMLIACDESATTLFSLKETDFSSEMEDSMVILVDKNGAAIELTGDLRMVEGECVVSMASPILDTTFKDVFTFVMDTTWSDTTYTEIYVEKIDTIYKADTIFTFDTIWRTNVVDTIKIDSIFVSDTLFSIDTLLKNRVVYQETFKATSKYSIDQKFDRITGKWIFKYSLNSIDDDVDPSGDLEFNVKYED